MTKRGTYAVSHWTAICLLLLFWCAGSLLRSQTPGGYQPAIPKVWDDAIMKDLEVPLARAEYSPRHVPASFYYQVPVRPIYKSYPVYHPDREPKGYIEWLRSREPEIDWDASKLKTKEDWIRAGETVFDAPLAYGSLTLTKERLANIEDLYVRKPAFFSAVQPPLSADGMLPFFRYVVRKKGVIDVGVFSCAMCHTRVMQDRTVVKGAQGNFPFDKTIAFGIRSGAGDMIALNRKLVRFLWFTPWVEPAFFVGLEQKDYEEVARPFDNRPGGVLTRHRSGPWAPIQVPDLIGIVARKYLDHTGLQQNRGSGDLMRYAALNQGGDDLSNFGGYVPVSEFSGPELDPKQAARYSDEQLFALAQYLDSLRPPANPNRFDATAAAGKKVFEREGCARCHTPPLYSNNKLTPAPGFLIPPEHRKKYEILDLVVGTDPALAMQTRRGTGYYKVPSLRGLWYREYFPHSGSCKTLEDWFDPARLRDDYVPTGARPYGVKTQAVKGHEFGLKLSSGDKKALIAFLKTL
jgi:mono/diheme cytochrome c family protein